MWWRGTLYEERPFPVWSSFPRKRARGESTWTCLALRSEESIFKMHQSKMDSRFRGNDGHEARGVSWQPIGQHGKRTTKTNARHRHHGSIRLREVHRGLSHLPTHRRIPDRRRYVPSA